MQPNNSAKFYGAAAQYNKPGGFRFNGRIIRIVIFALVLIVLIMVGYTFFTSVSTAGRTQAEQLVARQHQLQIFISANQASIVNDNLKTVNSNASALASSDYYALQTGLRATFGIAAVPEGVAAPEVDTTSAKLLAAAKTQSRFDQTYLQLLRDKIASSEQLARSVVAGVNGTMKTAAQTNLTNLIIIDGQLAKLQL